MKDLIVPLPSIIEQEIIIEKVNEQSKFIEGNKKLIEIYTQKIQDRINKIWGINLNTHETLQTQRNQDDPCVILCVQIGEGNSKFN